MPLRVAIVGLEPGTHWSVYVDAARQSPSVELAAVALRPELRGAVGERLAGLDPAFYDDARELLEREPVEVLALSTVPNQQADLLVEGLRRGLHVVADKPLVTTEADLARVRRELASRPGRRVSMLMTLRGDPVRQAARQLVRDGAIGRLAVIHSRRAYPQRRDSRPAWFFDEELSGGPWADGAIHGLDEVRWIAGRALREVVAFDANVSWPEQARFFDHGQALLRLEGDVTAILEHSRLALGDSGLSIVGTEGKIEIDRRDRGRLIDARGERELEAVRPLPPAINVFAEFVESVAAGRTALVDSDDALATTEAVFAVRRAARTGERVRFTD